MASSFPAIAEFAAGTVEKHFPVSHGQKSERRKRKPHIIAFIEDNCTGCAGSPACVDYCPVEDCMYWVPDADHPPFGRIEVDPLLCIGCKLCTSKGPDGTFRVPAPRVWSGRGGEACREARREPPGSRG